MKKKINKKKIVLLIILICLLILQIKAFTDSQANKLLEITLNAKDKSGFIQDGSIKLEAIDEGESGYSFKLPERIDGKKVSKYYITEKEVAEDKSKKNEQNTSNVFNTTNSTNNESATTSTESLKTTSKQPGEKIYLTNEEVESKKIELEVDYDKKEEDGRIYYNQEYTTEELEEKVITVRGYIVDNTTLKVEEKAKEDVTEVDSYLTEYGFNSAYDISLLDEKGNKADFLENLTIEIEKEDVGKDKKKEFKVIHILDKEEIEEVEKTQANETVEIDAEEGTVKLQEIDEIELGENKIGFKTESLSEFVLLEREEGGIISEENIEEPIESETASNQLIMTMALSTDVTAWDGSVASSFAWGEGTEERPYLISTGAELAFLGQKVRNGEDYEGIYFQLANDIDLGGREWTPIGTSQNSFRGIFDGAGHTIANATINVSSLPNRTYESYGIFASIGGGNTRSIIRNVELSSITIQITASGNTGTIDEGGLFGGGSVDQDNEGLHIGTLSGSMYRNASVTNVIVNNSVIQDTNVINIVDSPFQFSVGGVVGYVGNTYNNNNNPGNGMTYVIDNCYSQVQISLDATAEQGTIDGGWFGSDIDYNGHGQYHTGGIVGTIRSQAVWPTNSLYSGTINSNGFIGPIFGALINNTSYTAYNTFSTIWNGNDAGNLTTNNLYYTNYKAKNRSFTGSVTSGNSNQRISNSSNNIGYVQGLNKGTYTTDMNSMLNVFNNNTNSNSSYLPWLYENGTFTFKERLTSSVNENPENTYNLEITDPWQIGNYETTWYKNGEEDTSIDGLSYTWQENYEEDENWVVVVFDGEYYTAVRFTIERLGVDIVFDINENNDSVTASLEGPGLKYTTVDDFTFQWYELDIAGEENLLEGETGLYLDNLQDGMEYRLVATNEKIPQMSTENSFIYGNRTVIYVQYNGGNNRNDGLTPQTPVQNLSTAYGKLDRNGTTNSNIIVIMGNYSSNSFFNSANSSTYNKPATITGMYDGQDYNGRLYFYGGTSSYRYLTADTNFMYLDWYGTDDSSWWSGEQQLYLYLQGYNMTIGEGVTMVGYADSNTNQGLLGGNAPAVHIIAGWCAYNERQLPRNNSKIIIKSGAYGRIIGGGSPGTSSGQGQTTSHDFMGSSKEDSFHVEITIDIKNSTKGSYDYDVNLLTGGSAAGNNYSNVIQNIKNGSVGRLIGGSIGDSQTRPRNWNYPENTFLGTSTINVTGGSIEELYGGCLGRNMGVVGDPNGTGNTCDSYYYGTVTINISGGEITDNIYGAGAGGVTGYSENSSDPYKSYGQEFDSSVNINITGGTIRGDVYGGGYGYTEYLNRHVTADDRWIFIW